MILISKGSIQGVASAITDALISASKHDGSQFICPTIEPQKLLDIALGAITAVAGEVVMPAGTMIEVHVDDRPQWLRTVYTPRR